MAFYGRLCECLRGVSVGVSVSLPPDPLLLFFFPPPFPGTFAVAMRIDRQSADMQKNTKMRAIFVWFYPRFVVQVIEDDRF